MAHFKNIKVSNFRNFKDFNLDFSKKCNVFYGSNGCGKTNLLEAISIFSKGRGLRKDKIFNFIKKNEDYFSNDANFVDENIEYQLNVYSENKNNKFKKKIKLNGEISSEVNNKIQSLTPLEECEFYFNATKYCANIRNYFLVSLGMVGSTILKFGTKKQKKDYLNDLSKGKIFSLVILPSKLIIFFAILGSFKKFCPHLFLGLSINCSISLHSFS